MFCVFVSLISVDGFLKLYDSVTWTEASRYYWSVSPYANNIYNYRHEGENLDQPGDSIKYRPLIGGAWGDRETINVDFLVRISSDQLIDVRRLNPIDLARAIRTIGNKISPYRLLIVFMPITAAWVVLIVTRHVLPLMFWRNFLAFNFIYWSVVVLIAAFWKMPDRVLSPIVIAYITSDLLFTLSVLVNLDFKISKASHRFSASYQIISSLWLLTLLVLVFAGYKKIPTAKMAACRIAQTTPLREIIKRELAGKIVVFTFNASRVFLGHQPLLSVRHLSVRNQYMLVAGTWPLLLPEYPQHLKERKNRFGSAV